MGIDVNGEMIQKGLETAANLTKIAANATDAGKKEKNSEKKSYRGGDNTNQPHNQTVEVKVGNPENHQPTIIEKKPETHIHKHFPDNRALTVEECELEKMRIKLQMELDMRRLQWEQDRWDKEARERKEKEDFARMERERERAEMARKRKIRYIIGGALAALGIGCIVYDSYTTHRNSAAGGYSVKALPERTGEPIQADGEVK